MLQAATVAIGFAFAVTPAFAQADDVLADDASADKKEGDDASSAEEGGGESSTPDASASATPAGEKPATEETVFVVQGKPFLVAGDFEVTPQVVQSINDQFTSHTGLMVSGIYHLKENVAFELIGGAFGWVDDAGPRLGGRDSDLTIELREKESLAPERVKLYQFPWLLGADAQWSPMYGKVSVQDLVLGQFNLYLSVGAAVTGLQLESINAAGRQRDLVDLPFPSLGFAASFGGGLRFYFTDWLGLRLEVRDYVIPLSVLRENVEDADVPSFDVTNLVLGQLGVSFKF